MTGICHSLLKRCFLFRLISLQFEPFIMILNLPIELTQIKKHVKLETVPVLLALCASHWLANCYRIIDYTKII